MRVSKFVSSILLTACAFSASANLVTNGNFETGTFAGWTKGGNTSLSDVIANNVTSNHTFLWRSGATGSPASISQDLATSAGQHYTVSFDLFSTGTNAVSFQALFDNTSFYSFSNTVIGWTTFTFDVVAVDASSTLMFSSRNDPSFTRVDNISVEAVGNDVPEPASLALVGLGLAGLSVARRRKSV